VCIPSIDIDLDPIWTDYRPNPNDFLLRNAKDEPRTLIHGKNIPLDKCFEDVSILLTRCPILQCVSVIAAIVDANSKFRFETR